MLDAKKRRSIVRVVEEKLLTPFGLRTLAPNEDGYRPTYRGDLYARDSAYHQGTVWPWLIGHFVTAYLNAFGRDDATLARARSIVDAFRETLEGAVLGSIPEVFDADPPHRAGGAPSQAWSVAEVLRVIRTELASSRAR
jgi:glycogen debranching enzyme